MALTKNRKIEVIQMMLEAMDKALAEASAPAK